MRLSPPPSTRKKTPDSTGFRGPLEQLNRGRNRPLSATWVSDALLAETRHVWSRQYGRVVAEEEAMEILMNVRRLAEVLVGPYLKGDKP
jgi:hypothetical protein